MRNRIIFITYFLLLPLVIFAQASGGQIVRKQSNNNVISKSSGSVSKNRSYTAKEMYQIGRKYDDEGNYKDAMTWYTKAATLGFPEAQCDLGHLYYQGKGTPVNYSEAIKWLRKATEQGEKLAPKTLCKIYRKGIEVDIETLKWLRQMAEKGNEQIRETLGFLYKDGIGTAQNKEEAKKFLSPIAEKRYAEAKKIMKSNGREAISLFKEIASMDILPYSTYSLFHIGAIFYYGDGGVERDYYDAFKYFKEASDKGNRPAMYYVGICFEYGRGTQLNEGAAKDYYSRSGYKTVPSRNF